MTITTSAVATEPSSTGTIAVTSFQSFRIHRQGTSVALSWETTSTQVQHFLVERSYDGEYFETISTVGANGASYKASDDAPYAGYSYYRITAVNADHSTEASPVQTIRIVKRK
jgi:hypothetical protein